MNTITAKPARAVNAVNFAPATDNSSPPAYILTKRIRRDFRG